MRTNRNQVLNAGVCLLVTVVISLWETSASAATILQLYLEGATYDSATESWVLAPLNSNIEDPFRLWAIGNVSGPGGEGLIEDVRLSAVYDTSFSIGISLNPSTTDFFGKFTDPSTPSDPGMPIQTVTDGSTPELGDGPGTLAPHGEYGEGRTWQEFDLGNFTTPGDSPSGDFSNFFPEPVDDMGFQINVYEISVTPLTEDSLSGLVIHFDLYNTIKATNHAKFAPFSHDATFAPQPSSVILAGMGLLGMFGYGWRKRKINYQLS